MKHYGDITKINGAKVEPVDVITGGSPCQDLSVAGKRAGLAGERSGLFMEQIRIIKEMRNEFRQVQMRGSDVVRRPCRFMVWENVVGAFSSNNGDDFRAVLEETARVKDPDAIIPRPTDGKWTPCGCIVGEGYSLAWRTHDAQYWGVPQRRKRICLLADFDGDSAGRILFETELWREADDGTPVKVVGDIGDESRSEVQPFGESMSGNTEQGVEEGQGITGDAERGVREAISFVERAGCEGGARESLSNTREQEPCQRLTTNRCLNPWDVQSKHIQPSDGVAESLYSGECRYGGGESYVMCLNDQGGSQMNVTENHAGTLRAQEHGHQPCVVGFDAYNQTETGEVSKPLTNAATDADHVPVVYGISGYDSNSMKSPNPHSGIYEADTARTIDLNGGSPSCNQGGMAVVCLEGNGTRESHRGDGYKESDTMFTLNTVEQHAVCYGLDRASFNQGKNAQGTVG